MQMSAGDRIYTTWPLTGVPVDANVDVSVNGGAWVTVERPTVDSIRVLLAGPDAPDDGTPVTATLGLGRNIWVTRVTDNPEVITDSGVVYVVGYSLPSLTPSSPTYPITSTSLADSTAVGRALLTAPDAPTAVAALRINEGPLSFTSAAVGGVGDGATDNTAAFNSAMSQLATSGGELFFPAGVYRVDGATTTVPGGVTLSGTGYDYSDPSVAPPARASVIRAGAVMTRLIQLGSDPTVSTPGQTGASMRDLSLDGRSLAVTVLRTAGRRNHVRDCQVYWGSARAVAINGQNTHLIGGVYAQNDLGDVILVEPIAVGDEKIWDAQVRQPGTGGACIRVRQTSELMVQRIHAWTGQNGVSLAAEGLIVIEAAAAATWSGFLIEGNTLEGIVGPAILLKTTLAGSILAEVAVVGNRFYQPSDTGDAIYPVVQLAGPGIITGGLVMGNTARGNASGRRYRSWVDAGTTPLASSARWVIEGNTGANLAKPYTGTWPSLPVVGPGAMYDGATSARMAPKGRATFSGTGAQTAFIIAHSLPDAMSPTTVRVTPGSAAAAGTFYATADGTNITVTYLTPPPAGASNVVLNWEANVGA